MVIRGAILGDTWQCLETLGLSGGGDASSFWRVEARGAARHPAVGKAVPTRRAWSHPECFWHQEQETLPWGELCAGSSLRTQHEPADFIHTL